MTMVLPRLPSGIYFSLLADSRANQEHHVPEYPTFRRDGGGYKRPNPEHHHRAIKRTRVAAPHVNAITVDQAFHSSPPPLVPTPPRPSSPTPDLCLPLLSVSIEMQVDFNIAKTKLVQTFTNHGDIAIPEAWYSFPLYDGAAVIAFRCEVGDEKVLEGKVKPKEEARREFKRAVKKQEAAALVEEMAPDVFQTTIGNIQPKTTVKVEITYVEELHTDLGGDGILVTIPTSVAPRYGTPPEGYATNSAVKETGLSLAISIAFPDSLGAIDCRSGHEISVEHGKLNHLPEVASFEALAGLQSLADPGFDSKHSTVRLSDTQAAMDKDFLLFIGSSGGGGSLKSRALLAPPSDSDYAAMMVTVRPSELFSDLQESMDEFDGEVIFLADRSGSMSGSKIEALKDALLVFLKSLPEKCKFNLYSFGSSVSSLWPYSVPYDESRVNEAVDHISTFEADFGGTEVLQALEKAAGDRRSADASSTQLILLTDGEIWQPEQTIDFVRKTASETEGQVRFFSLGIGDRVSHQLIQGIGFFGCGFGETVALDEKSKWQEAVIRMLKGAVMPKSWSYSIELDDQWTEKRLDKDDFLPQNPQGNVTWALSQITGASSTTFVQAPTTIPRLHHFGQQSIYFLLNAGSAKLPEHVNITASSQHGGTKTATLSVTRAISNNNTIQHLTAKAAVRDLENQDTAKSPSSDHVRRNAEQLCQMYSVSSKWTSFVAVSHLQESAECEEAEINLYKAPLADLDLLMRRGTSQAKTPLRRLGRPQSPVLGNRTSRMALPYMDDAGTRALSNALPYASIGALALSNAPDNQIRVVHPQTRARQVSPDPGNSSPSKRAWSSASLVSELDDVSDTADCIPSPSTSTYRYDAAIAGDGSSSEDSESDRRASRGIGLPQSPSQQGQQGTSTSRAKSSAWTSGPRAIEWQEITRAQLAGGLFRLNKYLRDRMDRHFCHGTREAVRRWLAIHAKRSDAEEPKNGGMMGLLIDTVTTLAYARSHFHSQRALWELVVQKAERMLVSRLDPVHRVKKDDLSAMADSALAHAHYSCFLQDSDHEARHKDSQWSGRCRVCDAWDGEWPPSVMQNDDDFWICSAPGCGVSVRRWDEFWAHVVEQGHIYSSCRAARDRYEEAEAEAEAKAKAKDAGAGQERSQD